MICNLSELLSLSLSFRAAGLQDNGINCKVCTNVECSMGLHPTVSCVLQLSLIVTKEGWKRNYITSVLHCTMLPTVSSCCQSTPFPNILVSASGPAPTESITMELCSRQGLSPDEVPMAHAGSMLRVPKNQPFIVLP